MLMTRTRTPFWAVLLFILSIFTMPLPVVYAAAFSVDTVNDTADANPGDGVCDDGTGACSLRAAIEEANAFAGADDITFAIADATITLTAALPDINTAITITGNGNTVIQANAAPATATYRIFTLIAGGDLAIDGLVLQNGNPAGSGGAILVASGATLSVENSIIRNNNSSAQGGGIYNEGTITQISNTLIESNSVSFVAFAAAGGGIRNVGTITLIENTTFYRNSASSTGFQAIGGAVHSSGIITTIRNTTFSQNTVTGDPVLGLQGGGFSNLFGTVGSIQHSSFVNNTIQYVGSLTGGVDNTALYTNTDIALTNNLFLSDMGGQLCQVTNPTSNNYTNLAEDISCTQNIPSSLGTYVDETLRDNGCVTPLPDGTCVPTHALLSVAGNPAIDAFACVGIGTDERGLARDATCDAGAYEFIARPDLTVTKTNSAGGAASTGVPFTWTLTLANSTGYAGFVDGETILSDQLPATNITYGPVTVDVAGATNVSNVANMNCAIVTNLLTCVATGPIRFDPASSISLSFAATATDPGIYVNPTGGSCEIDPDDVIIESNETNNTCLDAVTVQSQNAAVVILQETVPATEGGADGLLWVVLNSQPTANVNLAFAYTNGAPNGAQTIAGTPVTFTPANWDTPQQITLEAIDDLAIEGAHTDTITVTATSTDLNYDDVANGNGGSASYFMMSNQTNSNTVLVDIADNDAASISVDILDGIILDENGPTSDTFVISATTPPTADVTIQVTTNAQCAITAPVGGLVTLPAGSTAAQIVTVQAVPDGTVEGLHTCTITTGVANSLDLDYDAINPADVVAAVVDVPGGIINITNITQVSINEITNITGHDLQYIIKTVDNPLATVGQTVTYTIRATNPKDIPLTQVVIYDVFDERLVDVTLRSTTHGFGTFVENTLIVSGFDLQPGEEATIIVSATIAELEVGSVIPNSAILESPDASVHVSNLALVGDAVQSNDGNANTILVIPNTLPSTGETPQYRQSIFTALVVIGMLLFIALVTFIIPPRYSAKDKE